MSDRMPKVDLSKLKKSDLIFMQELQKQNQERVKKLKILRKNNIITGGLLTFSVLGIYGYSMYAVKQESFLDDFEEPAKINQ